MLIPTKPLNLHCGNVSLGKRLFYCLMTPSIVMDNTNFFMILILMLIPTKTLNFDRVLGVDSDSLSSTVKFLLKIKCIADCNL